MVEKKEKEITRSLEIIDPKLYRYIVEALNEKHNIHSYDIELFATKKDLGLTITLKFGEDFAHSKEKFFEYETLKNRSEEFVKFIHEVADECQRAMVAEYFNMMKP